MKAAARLLVLLLVLAAVSAGLLLQWQGQPQDPRLLVVDETGFVKSDDPAPPDAATWVLRKLPDNWRTSNPGLSGYGWYRVAFVLPEAPDEPWAVYIPTVSTTYQLFLNGVAIGTGGGMTGAIARSMNVPRLDQVPAHLLHAGDNRIDLRLRVAPNLRGGLGTLTLGPRAAVEELYDADFFARVTLPRSLNIALVFVGILVLLLWLRRPSEGVYGAFAALAIVWSLRNFHYTISPAWMPSGVWEAYVLGSLGVVVVLLWLFVLRFTGTSLPRAERWLTGACALTVTGISAVAMFDPQAASTVRIGWYLMCAAVGVWSVAILIRCGLQPAKQRRTGVWVILAAALIALALGLTDLAVSAELLPFGPSARMAYGAPVLLCALVYAMADGYFRTYDEVRSLNTDLERRVAERTGELQRTHEKVLALERVTTLAGERERMMRDMHDGIGSQLMTTLDAVERGGKGQEGVAAMLRDCIDDLRLMIDSLEPDDQSLAVALANLRYRLEPRLAAAGIALDWELDRQVALPGPGGVLQLLRVVQEALTNVLKHAGASRLRVCARAEADDLVLEVQDNGRGIDPTHAGATGTGRGLENMKRRAQQLGGSLQVSSTSAGTLLTLRIPAAAQPG